MRQHRQGFMKCWNAPHHTASPPCWMEKWKIPCRMLWKVRDREREREGWPARSPSKGGKRKTREGKGNRFPSNSHAPFAAHQNLAITNVKVLSWIIMSQTCCQCSEESLLFELLQFTSKFIAQEKTNIYLIQIGTSRYIQLTSQTWLDIV